jgi:hypothetical protein
MLSDGICRQGYGNVAGCQAMRQWPAKMRAIGVRAAIIALVGGLCASAGPARAEAEPVKVATQVDRGSGRLVLEWRRPVDYTVEQAPPYTFVRFSRAFGGDIEPAQRALGRWLAELRVAGGGRVLVLRIVGQPRFIHYRRGNAVILTWIGAGRAGPSEGPTDSRSAPAQDPPRLARMPPLQRPTAPPPPPGDLPQLARAGSPPAAPAPPAGADKAPPAVTKEPPAAPEPPAKADDKPPLPPDTAPPAITPTLAVSTSGTETRIVVAWPEPTAAAVFRYGDHVWIVFPRREAFDVAGLQQRLGPGIERLQRVEHAQATVLAVRARADVRARLLSQRNVWTIVLKREAGPAREAEVKLGISRGAQEQVAIPLPGAEAPIRLVDTDVGSTLHVVPSRALAAVGGERRFVAFRLIPAVQGGVVEALADGLVVGAEAGAIVIRRSGGLLLSGGPLAGAAQHGQR